MKIGKGTLVVNDGVYVNEKDSSLSEFAKGMVRKDFTYEEAIKPRFIAKNDQKSFSVKVNCTHRVNIYRNEISYETKIVLSNEKEYNRISGKKYLKDIKNFICGVAGPDESSKVRKRLIALERIHKSISNQTINFDITDQ